MKLTAYLLTLLLVFVYGFTGPRSSIASIEAAKHTGRSSSPVLEQPRRDCMPTQPWACWEVWLESTITSGRRRRRRVRRWRYGVPGKRGRLQRRFQRWYRRWRRLWRQWQALLCGVEGVTQPGAVPTPEPTDARLAHSPAALAESEVPPEPVAKRGRGRPRSILTTHRCCPHEGCLAYGKFGDDSLHNIVGLGTYPTQCNGVRQMYLCKVCRQPFSETAGTPFFGLKTPTQTVCMALQELAEGLGIRAVARIHGVQPDTVLAWLKKAGLHCEALSEYMLRELPVTQVQLDELWTFVHKKERMLTEWEKLYTEWGDTWVWVAFDPVHKLVIAVLVGEHGEEEAVDFVARLRARLAAACQPLLTSDSLPHYVRAILQVFGVWTQPQRKGTRGRFPQPRQVPPEDLKYATVHKQRQQGRVVSVTTHIIYGRKEEILALLSALGQKINTSFVERFNLTLRHLLSRLHRKTLCFSKQRAYLVYHLHLALAYYHFTRYHASLRVALPEPIPTRGTGSPKQWQQRTPAMAAGLTDHAWSLRELLMYPTPP